MNLLSFVVLAAILAIVCTLLTLRAIILAGYPANEMVGVAVCCLWLIAVYGGLKKLAERVER